MWSCVQASHSKHISVKVDLSEVPNANDVGIRGAYPLSWNETTYLEDENNDGIYEGEFTIYTAVNAIEFKFVNQHNQFELTDTGNRRLTFTYQPETIIYEATFNNLSEVRIIRK